MGFTWTRIDSQEIVITASKAVFQREAILAACYGYSRRYQVKIEPGTDSTASIFIRGLEDTAIPDELAQKVYNDIIDHQLRLDLNKQNGRLRELIVQHAFQPVANLKAECVRAANA